MFRMLSPFAPSNVPAAPMGTCRRSINKYDVMANIAPPQDWRKLRTLDNVRPLAAFSGNSGFSAR
jgi:hypothetical protein